MAEPEQRASRRAKPGDTVEMSANLVLRHLVGFRMELGSDAVDRALRTLPTELQGEVGTLVAGDWLAVDKIDIVYGSIAEETDRSLEQLVPTVIGPANEQVFNTVWKALLRLAPGRLILRRAPAVYRKSYSHGVMTCREVEGVVELDVTHWPGITRNRIQGITAGIRATLRISGSEDARVTHRRTPDGACFVLRF